MHLRTDSTDPIVDPSPRHIFASLAICLVLVAATRLPIARVSAFDFDEVGFLDMIREAHFPRHHTLFLASARVIGDAVNDPYRGFVDLDCLVSGLALAATWWWLRAVVTPRAAAIATLILGVGPVFWSYGAMAANYTAIPLVGGILLGIAVRCRESPRPWHPYVAAVALALGAGYRQDIGTFWFPVFLLILWRFRVIPAIQAILVFAMVCLAWFVPMLRDAGGWASYRADTSRFAYKSGYLNSIWHLGPIDSTLRYIVKLGLALFWTLGPALVFVVIGAFVVLKRPGGWRLIGLMLLAAIPALGMHLLVHFGVPGYAFHYLPALVALMAIGLGRAPVVRGGLVAAVLAGTFLLYPTDLNTPGFRLEFDLTIGRYSRIGLATKTPPRDPDVWRTVNSQRLPLNTQGIPTETRRSVLDLLSR